MSKWEFDLNTSFEIESVLQLGGLTVVKSFCDRLGLARLIDEHLPLAPQATVGHGATLVALVMNKLSDPKPLYKIEEWAETFAVEPLLGIKPEDLNDDRLGRMLDAVADKVETLKTEICFTAIEQFGLDVGRLHWDLTSFEFCGDFDEQDPAWPALTYGYNTAGVGKHVQCRVGNLVCGDGAVGGLMHTTYPGNHSDQNSVHDHLHLFRELARRHRKKVKVVGDSKLLSPEVMVTFEEAGVYYIFPEPSSKETKALLESVCAETLPESLNGEVWKELEYLSQQDAKAKSKPNPTYKGLESTFQIEIAEEEGREYTKGTLVPQLPKPQGGRPPKPRRVYDFRRIVVFSGPNRVAQQKNRARQCARLEEKLRELNEKFQTNWWKNKPLERAQKALNKELGSFKISGIYRCELTKIEGGGWSLRWSIDPAVLADAERTDGLYTLATNIPKEEASINAVFLDYKRQTDAERRFSDWKSPLQVRPVFLKSNKRVVGLILIMAIALLIFCLIEREARSKLPEGEMAGLLPVKRAVKATGSNILDALRGLQMIGIRTPTGLTWKLSPLNAVQNKLIKLFATDSSCALNKGSPR